MSTPDKSIRKIQIDYFRLLSNHFFDEWRDFETGEKEIVNFFTEFINRYDRGIIYPGKKSFHKQLRDKNQQLLIEINEFWEQYYIELHAAIREIDSMNILLDIELAQLGKNLSPLIRRLGIYFDTVCITDPLCMYQMNQEMNQDLDTEIFFASYLRIREIKSLVLSDCSPPLCIVYPLSYIYGNDCEEKQMEISTKSKKQNVQLIKSVFDIEKDMAHGGEIIDVVRSVSMDKLTRAIANSPIPSFLPVFKDARYIPEVFFGDPDLFNQLDEKERLAATVSALGEKILHQLAYQDHECRALILDPLDDSETLKWEIRKWKMLSDSKDTSETLGLTQNEVAMKALNSKNMKWLSNISKEDLIRLREAGGLEDLRKMFRVSWKQLRRASLDQFDEVSTLVMKNVMEALKEHSDRLQKDQKEYKRRLGLNVAGIVVTASLAIASVALPPLMPLAVGAGIISLTFGGKSVRDFINDKMKHKKEMAELSERPIAILLRTKENPN